MHQLPPLLLTSFLFMTASPAWSQNDIEWFVGLNASLGEDTIDGISHGGSIGTGAVIGGQTDGAIRDDEIDDYTAGIGITVGRRSGNWNIAAEFIYRYRTDFDTEVSTPSIQTITNIFADVETSTLLLNASRRGVINRNWSWELGAGAGFVRTNIDADYIEREIPGVSPELRFNDSPTDTEFAYNVFAGVTRDLGGPWTMNLRYRYIDMGDLEAGPFPGRPGRIEAEHTAQEMILSFERDL